MFINISTPKDIRNLTNYIAHCNSQLEKHIGFCGEDSSAISDEIENDFSDLSIEDSFLVAYEGSLIIGAIGLDIDCEDNSAEVWGPFIDDNNIDLAEKLWSEILLKVPAKIKKFKFFINEHNTFIESFLNSKSADFLGSHSLLNIEDKEFIHKGPRDTVEISESYINSFINLHDTVFVNAYYNAREILGRLNNNNRLLLLAKDDFDIEGYAYIEIRPKYHESDIEFVAVHPAARAKGLGRLLLYNALETIFDYPEINDVSLTVSHKNMVALNLYKSVGFQEIYILRYYQIEK